MSEVEIIEARVAAIARLVNDPEAAHGEEDSIWFDVLTNIASGMSNARELAAAAVRTRDIKFPRWCA